MKERQYHLRLLEHADLPAVLAISQLSARSAWTLESFESCFKENYCAWVLETEHELCGFLISLLNLDELEILNLAVHPAYRRQGLAEQLFQHLMQFAKAQKIKCIHLEVSAENHSAIGLYEKYNFRLVGRRKNYYVTEEGAQEALLFAKDVMKSMK